MATVLPMTLGYLVFAGQEPTPYFAAKIPIDVEGRAVLYVGFRSSYAATRKGISVEYCTRDFGGDAGVWTTCYVYDAHGESYSMDDSAVSHCCTRSVPWQSLLGP